MINEEIYTKYADALFAIGREDGQLQGQAVSLALRLAIADGVTAGRSLAAEEAATLRQKIERKEHLLLDLQAVLDAATSERDGLRQQLMQMDADAAELSARLSAAEHGWAAAQADADRLALQVVQQPIVIHSNGTGAAVAPTPAHDAAWWADLDSETNDYRISLEAGRRTFRQISKERRLLLAQAVARHIGGGALPLQQEFDAGKPDWMPGGGGLVKSFGITWSELLDLREIAEP